MINRLIKGRGFRGLLDYLASRPGAEIVGGNMEGANPRELAREFRFVRQLRPRLGRAVLHLPLRLPPSESLDPEQWRHVAERVLAGLGFTDSPYVLYSHPHAGGGRHVHLVASRIGYRGEVVSDSNDYRRAMAILRRIEIDYGLRQVPCPEPRARPAPTRERFELARTGETSTRAALQDAVTAAAAASRDVSQFLAELDRRGVQVQPRITATGQVTGLRYRRGPLSFTGTGLGSAFTWPALLRHSRLDFAPARDLPALVAAGKRFAATDPPAAATPPTVESAAPPAPPTTLPTLPAVPETSMPTPDPSVPPVPPAPAPAAPSAAADRTTDQVRRQLAALASPRYDVLVLDAATGVHRHYRGPWTADQVLAAVPWLKHQNAAAGEVLIRPVTPLGYTLLAGVSRQAIDAARRAGFEPAAVLRGDDGAREVWLRAGFDIAPPVLGPVEQALAERFRAARPPAVPGYGHLAGFTSPLAQRAASLARPPFVALHEAAGAIYRAAPALAARAERDVAERQLAARVDREIAGLPQPAAPPLGAVTPAATATTSHAATPAVPAPLRPADPRLSAKLEQALRAIDAETVRRGLAAPPPFPADLPLELAMVEGARRAYRDAWAALHGPPPPDQAARDAVETKVVDTYRAFRATEDALADRLGITDLPADLAPEPLAELARRQTVLLRAEARLFDLTHAHDSSTGDLLEASTAASTLERELGDHLRRHGFAAASADFPDPSITPPPAAAAPAPSEPAVAELSPPAAAAPAAAPTSVLPAYLDPSTRDDGLLKRHLAATERLAALEAAARQPAAAATPAALADAWRAKVLAGLALESREIALNRGRRAFDRLHEQAAVALDAVEPRVWPDAWSPQLAAYHNLADRTAQLERFGAYIGDRLVPLARARLDRDLARRGRDLLHHPTESGFAAFARLLDQRRDLPTPAGPAAHAADRHRPGRPGRLVAAPIASVAELDEMRAGLRGAVQHLVREPAAPALAAATRRFDHLRAAEERAAAAAATRDLRAARRDLRRAGDRLIDAARDGSDALISPFRLSAWRAALTRHDAAETAFAARFDRETRPLAPTASALPPLLRRLSRGDLTPDTLARLQVTAGLELLPDDTRLRPPAPDRRPPAASLVDALAEVRADRAAFLAAARRLNTGSLRDWLDGDDLAAERAARDLDSLRTLAGRYQTSLAHLHRHTDRLARGPESQLVPFRSFLDHPAFAGQPHRAAAAWSAHALQQGLPPDRLPQLLARARLSLSAAPRLFSAAAGGLSRLVLRQLAHLGLGAAREAGRGR